jgi:hypothetical protein
MLAPRKCWVDPRELITGDNVRLDAARDKGFIADIAERGVRQIIPVHRDESGCLVVRTDQRRVLAAIEAGLARVRVVVEAGQLTDARARNLDRIVDQLGEKSTAARCATRTRPAASCSRCSPRWPKPNGRTSARPPWKA